MAFFLHAVSVEREWVRAGFVMGVEGVEECVDE